MSPLRKLRRLMKRKKKNTRSHSKTKRTPVMESRAGAREGGTRKPQTQTRYPSYRRKPSRWFKRFIKRAIIWGTVFAVAAYAWLSYTLPDIDDLNKFAKAPSVLIKSEDGQIIGSFGDIYGDYVSFEELPASLADAVIATEDRNFYHHFGIDPLGLLRATIANIRAGHVVQGGSTITQQVAKNVFLTPERSFLRKIREMMLAVKLESRFSKQEILSIYFNRVYLGGGNYGVDAASKRYFDKPASEMTLSESAIIAGLLKAPSKFAPTSNPILSRKRADQVLVNMADAGYLTKEQVDKARKDLEKTTNSRQRTSQSNLYFADWILDQLPEYVGNIQEDIVVTTTLNPDWQVAAEKAITDVMDKDSEKYDASQAAILAMTPDGAIRVMIGGRSYSESQFNRTTQSQRQPGSSFKLFVYLAGLAAGMTPDTLVDDEPITIPIPGGNWTPKNYTGKYLGTITLKEAVTDSINTIAVRVTQHVGVNNVVAMARRLGITSDLDAVPAIALGATEVNLLELTGAYAHLASRGALVTPYGIMQIETKGGKPLYRRQGGANGAALSGSVVGMMNEMLMSVTTSGTGRGAQIGRPIAGKTGTTSDYKDAWFIGFTPQLVAGVWVGNDDNRPMKKVTGGMLPAMIWRGFMKDATAKLPVEQIPTEGGGFFSSLPWQSGETGEMPPVYRGTPPPPATANGGDVNLGTEFWDKLFGDEKPRR